MEIEWAAICEEAREREFGAADLTGAGIRFLFAPGLPARAPACLAVRVAASEPELGRDASFEMKLRDPDLVEVPVAGTATLRVLGPEEPELSPPGGVVRVFSIFRFPLAIRDQGLHSLELYLDGDHKYSVPFSVRLPNSNP
jgi:hypothetical protein